MYMTVYDLNREQLDELKETYFSQLIDTGDGDEILGNVTYSRDIPDEVIFNHYDGISFTDDDFFCSCDAKKGHE